MTKLGHGSTSAFLTVGRASHWYEAALRAYLQCTHVYRYM